MRIDADNKKYLDNEEIKALNKYFKKSLDTRFKNAKVGERIKSGGQAVVYHLIPKKSNDKYVVKVLISDSENVERFFRKINDVNAKLIEEGFGTAISKIEHSFIAVSDGEQLYCLIERFVNCLSDYKSGSVNDSRDNIEIAVRIGLSLLPMLQCCADNKIIHRDIKPDNIFLRGEKLSDDLCLGDFGIVTHEDSDGSPTTIMMRGTADTMAPDFLMQLSDDERFNDLSRSDMYSLGITMYYYLNGKTYPFIQRSVNTPEKTRDWLNERKKGCDYPKYGSTELKELVYKAVSFCPDDRFSSCAEMLEELKKTPEYQSLIGKPVGLDDTNQVYKTDENSDNFIESKPKSPTPEISKNKTSHVKDIVIAMLVLIIAAGGIAFAVKNKTPKLSADNSLEITEIQSSSALSATTAEAWSELTSDLSAIFADGQTAQDAAEHINEHTIQKTTWLNRVVTTAKQTAANVTTTLKAAVTTKKTTAPSTTEQTIFKGKCGTNLTWILDLSTGELVISGTGAMTDWEDIGNSSYSPWYNYKKSIKLITIKEGVTSIGDYAFIECENLTQINIQSDILSVGKWAFRDCTNLISVLLPNSVVDIGECAFSYCEKLSKINIGNKVKTIGDSAFLHCVKLESITIPNSVITIGQGAFYFCSSLKNITLPDSIISIGSHAFQWCENLKKVSLGKGITSISYHMFACCPSLENVIFYGEIKNIEELAFSGCSMIKSIIIPDSVSTIGDGAFSECDNLCDIYYRGTKEQWNKISFGKNNDDLLNATVHYNS